MTLRTWLVVRAFLFWTLVSQAPPLGGASAQPEREKNYLATALESAKKLDRPEHYTYQPRHDPSEIAAVSVAVNSQVLLEAYKAGGPAQLLAHARLGADSLLAHADMNEDGKAGWGRFWRPRNQEERSPGANTAFISACSLPRNRPYDDELYDDARITQFLVSIFQVTKERRYLDTARQAIDATWNVGELTFGGNGFSYFKTIGACSRGWQVKNINMLMAVPLALLAQETDYDRYRRRAEQLVHDQRMQIRRVVYGKSAPNLGYYTFETMTKNAHRAGLYVERTQVVSSDGSIQCNTKTGAGKSCTAHLGIEARGLALAEHFLGRSPEGYREDVLTIMRALERRDGEMCSRTEGQAHYRTSCVAYYCALRHLSADFDEKCYTKLVTHNVFSQDIILGLFWGT